MILLCLTNGREDGAGTADIVNFPELRMEKQESKEKSNYVTTDRDSPAPMISRHWSLRYIRSS